MRRLLEQVLGIAHDAGAAIMSIYARDFSIALKEDASPITEADQAAHEVIMQGLQRLATPLPILSEEGVSAFAGVADDARYWLVDPLDGTKEFIKRNHEFTVNIALIERGQPVLGVVVAPALGVAYFAARGVGAFKAVANGQWQPIRVAGQPDVGQTWRVLGSRSHADAELNGWLNQFEKYTVVPMGSSLKFGLIAEGRADVYPRFGPTCLWDTAAAHAVVIQAGGRVETLSGEALSYADPTHTLNPSFIVWGS